MKFFSTLVASTLGVLIASGIMLFLFILFIVAVSASSSEKPAIARNSVLTLDLSGAIPERGAADPISQAFASIPAFGLYDVVEAIDLARDDSRIKAIWIRSNGGSTSWSALHEIREALAAFKDSGKTIVASSSGLTVGERDYYVMSIADSIYAMPGAPFEFNGFYINVEFYTRTLEMLDIDPQIIRAGKFKGAVEPYLRENLSPENAAQLQAVLDTQESVFVNAVATSRAIDVAGVNQLLSSNAISTTEGAVDAGLIDRLAYLDEVENHIRTIIGVDEEDDIPTVSTREYTAVTPRDVGRSRNSRNELAVLYADGDIVNGNSQQGSSVGAASFRDAVRKVREREAVKAVVLRIESPGGSATASDEILQELRSLANEKPLLASMGSMAASGGYWIAMAADTIVATPLTLTGSIGVFSMFFDLGDLLSNKVGIDVDGVRTGQSADMLSGMRPLSNAEREALGRSVDETYDRFLDLVAANRRMTTSQIHELAQGRIWTGSDAKAQGLVDEIGGIGRSIELAAGMAGLEADDYVVTTFPRPTSIMEQWASRLEASVRAIVPAPKLGRLQSMAVERLRIVDELLQDGATIQARLPITVTVQ